MEEQQEHQSRLLDSQKRRVTMVVGGIVIAVILGFLIYFFATHTEGSDGRGLAAHSAEGGARGSPGEWGESRA